jgi:hypothetical protein
MRSYFATLFAPKNTLGVTAKEFLHAARIGGAASTQLVKRYIREDSRAEKLTVQDEHGNTALHLAVLFHHTAIIKVLLHQEHILLCVPNHKGNTVLMLAAARGFLSMLRDNLLPKAMLADLTLTNHHHLTALQIATNTGHLDIAALIMAHQQAYFERYRAPSNAKQDGITNQDGQQHKRLTPQQRLDAIGYQGQIPEDYCCPIAGTHQLMLDPVTTSSGETFDRQQLIQYFQAKNNPDTISCPMTRRKLSRGELSYPTSRVVKNAIETFVVQFECEARVAKRPAIEAANPIIHNREDACDVLKPIENVKRHIFSK